jgi:hypothetical protein
MKIISFIEDEVVIEKILKHLGLECEGQTLSRSEGAPCEDQNGLLRFSGLLL